MTNTKAAKAINLLESCGATAEFLRLVRGAVASLDGSAPSAELDVVLAALDSATDAAVALDLAAE